jgi:hypothetical protein
LGEHSYREKLPLDAYTKTLGNPECTIEAGPPAPVGHRNNQVHVFDRIGIYLTEHHSTRLIESVNFIFDTTDSPFPIEHAFSGVIDLFGTEIRAGMQESDLAGLKQDLPGEYSLKGDRCWIGVSTMGRKGRDGKRRKPRLVVRVSVCF